MSEHEPREPLEAQIAKKFKTVATDALIRRIERAADFGYDDEQYELNRRLRENGQTWRWKGDRVEVIGHRLTQDDLRIDEVVREWEAEGKAEPIDDTTARMIASQWHGGQASEFYSFASTGRIDKDGLTAEMDQNIREVDPNDDIAAGALEALIDYFTKHGDRDVQEGWHGYTKWGGE